MQMQAQLMVVGMKASKGTLDNGTAFDTCKVYCLIDMDARKGNAKGQGVAEYAIGQASEFDKFKHLTFPFQAVAQIEMLTTGSTQRTVITELRPVADPVKPGKS